MFYFLDFRVLEFLNFMILIFLNLGVSVFCFAPPAQISKKSSAPSAPLNKKIAK